MKKHFFFLPAVLMITALPLSPLVAQETATKATSSEKVGNFDQKFVTKAAKGGMAEVKLGKLASEKASRADVKKFGERMVADHGKANAELESIAKGKGMKLPEQPGRKDAKTYEKLSKLNGKEFDNAYINEMVKDHQQDVGEFEKAATKLNDPDLKAFAQKTLPVLKSHLQNITEIKNAKE